MELESTFVEAALTYSKLCLVESYLIKPKVDENNNLGEASNDNCKLPRPSVEKVEAKKSRPSIRLMLTTAVVIVASGLFHLHSDKRPYDELRDFPYSRIPLFPRSGHESKSLLASPPASCPEL